ncbi:MAG: zinc-finger-containing protein [Raoultibacter sp.]
MNISLYPSTCNLCGGDVIYTSNADVYHGKEYGSGKCYLCTKCGAYVGTHVPRPDEAFGVLADKPMREGKMACHKLFDSFWRGKKNARWKRAKLYEWLAGELSIDVRDCHFGYFNRETLSRAYSILKDVDVDEINEIFRRA